MALVMVQALEPILSSELVVGKSMFVIVFDIKTPEIMLVIIISTLQEVTLSTSGIV